MFLFKKSILLLIMSSVLSSFLYAAEADYPSSINELTNKQALTILGLPTNKLKKADLQLSDQQDAIKKAYRKLAMKYHPDKQGGKSAAEQKLAEKAFKNVSMAYQRLTDLDNVSLDLEEEYGFARSKSTFTGSESPGFTSGFGRSGAYYSYGSSYYDDPFDDLFSQFFKQSHFGGRSSSGFSSGKYAGSHADFDDFFKEWDGFFKSGPKAKSSKKDESLFEKVEKALNNQKLSSVRSLLLDPSQYPNPSFLDDVSLLRNVFNSKSLLHVAIEEKDVELVELLIEKISVDQADNFKDNALHFIAKYFDKNEDLVKKIISKSADINKKDRLFFTPLRHAVLANNLIVAKALIEAGVLVKKEDFGWTDPVMCAESDEMKALLTEHVHEEEVFDKKSSSTKQKYRTTKPLILNSKELVFGLILPLLGGGFLLYKKYKEIQGRKARREAMLKKLQEKKEQEVVQEAKASSVA